MPGRQRTVPRSERAGALQPSAPGTLGSPPAHAQGPHLSWVDLPRFSAVERPMSAEPTTRDLQVVEAAPPPSSSFPRAMPRGGSLADPTAEALRRRCISRTQRANAVSQRGLGDGVSYIEQMFS